MLKIQARAQRAIRQADRALKRYNERQKRRQATNVRKNYEIYQKYFNEQRKVARAEEKEDRMLGPLAPQRIADDRDRELHGSIPLEYSSPPQVLREDRIKFWNIVPGDRVVVLKGHDRHRIGEVKRLNRENNTLIVDDLNKLPLKISKAYQIKYPGSSDIMEMPCPLHYNDVRLVYPLPDPETGELRDTIIANIAMSKVWWDRRNSTCYWKRYVAGTNTVIPWPKATKKEHIDKPGDTRIMDVETRTYVPTLLMPPFPLQVIDELRNKYSKFRTRHDPEYIAKKEAEEEERKRSAEQMVLTPIQELNRKLRKEKKARGWPELSPEALENIGRVMADNRPELLERLRMAGVE